MIVYSLNLRCEPVNRSRSIEQFYSVLISYTTLCSTFLLPTNAIVVGNLLFGNSSYSSLQKTLLVSVLLTVININANVHL